LAEEARKKAADEEQRLRREVAELMANLDKAEEAVRADEGRLKEEVIKGPDSMRTQLASKDALIAAHNATIAELQKTIKEGEKGASEQMSELRKALADKEREMKAAVAERDKEVKGAEAAAKKAEEAEASKADKDKVRAELDKVKHQNGQEWKTAHAKLNRQITNVFGLIMMLSLLGSGKENVSNMLCMHSVSICLRYMAGKQLIPS
jgi:chromosome segregation ATPase